MQGFLEGVVLGNTGEAWLRALAIALLIGVGIRFVFWRVVVRVEKWSRTTATRADDYVVATLRQTKFWFILAAAVWGGSLYLTLPESFSSGIWLAMRVFALLQAAIWSNAALGQMLNGYRETVTRDNPSAATGLTAISVVARGALWTIFFLFFLQNLGIHVTALVTGLGIGGIAIALAVQNVLSDLLASLSIIFDRPFEVGDFVVVDDLSGTVENVGLKTTRMKSISGEQLVFNNSDLLSSRIRNYKRMQERRILFTLGVVYGTPRTALEEIPSLIQRAIEAQENTRFDRCYFKSLGDSALVYEAVFFMLVPEFDEYTIVQQAINLDLYEEFEQRNIDFAFPTQTVHVEGLKGSLLV